MADYKPKYERVIAETINRYKQETGYDKFIYAFMNILQYSSLYYLRREKIAIRGVFIKDIVPVKSQYVPHIVTGLHNGAVASTIGVARIVFSNDVIVFAASVREGFGKSGEVNSYLIGKKKDVNFVLSLSTKGEKVNKFKAEAVKDGVYRIFSNNENQIIYSKHNKNSIARTPVIHDAVSLLDKDMKFFFNNMNIFTRYGQPGTRKALLVGPPGTGKTSLAMKVVREYRDSYPIVFSDDVNSISQHLNNMSHVGKGSIVIIEDAETILKRDNSGVLNFLDGIHMPKNKKGVYIIMTTNFPDMISDRIKKRPGRIDKIINVGTLSGDQAIECAKLYFPKRFDDFKELFDNFTGAQIKEISNSTRAFAAQNNLRICKETTKMVIAQMSSNLKGLLDVSDYNSDMKDGINKPGFNISDDIF